MNIDEVAETTDESVDSEGEQLVDTDSEVDDSRRRRRRSSAAT